MLGRAIVTVGFVLGKFGTRLLGTADHENLGERGQHVVVEREYLLGGLLDLLGLLGMAWEKLLRLLGL